MQEFSHKVHWEDKNPDWSTDSYLFELFLILPD